MSYVSIIILTYNSEKYIKKLVESIYEFNKGEEFEIIVVDNNSTDGTEKEVLSIKNKVLSIQTGENLGFARGINFGAQKAKGEYLLFINPDSSWKEGKINDMITVFDHFENVGIVGGKMESAHGPEKSAGKFLKFWACFFMTFGLDEVLGIRFATSEIKKVDFVSGGFMMVNRDLFEKLNGFDEHYFMYVEDMDLCFRAKKHGKLTFSTPHAVTFHAGQGSSSKSFAIRNITKGLLYFNRKYSNALSYSILSVLLNLKALTLVLASNLINN